MIRGLINFSWAILWGLVMLFLMLRTPNGDMPSFFPGFDKLAHCGSFYLLTVLILFGKIIQRKGMARKYLSALWAFLITTSFAFLTEFAQYYFTRSRSAEWWDIFADLVGIGMGIFSFLLFYRKRF